MKIGRIHSWKKVTAQLLLLTIPTIGLALYLLFNANRFYSLLQNNWQEQGIYFSTGIVVAGVFGLRLQQHYCLDFTF